MTERRITPRRKYVQPERANKDVEISFGCLPMHARFTLHPDKYVNLDFIKTHSFGAQLYSWDNESSFPDQRFGPDDKVWWFPPKAST